MRCTPEKCAKRLKELLHAQVEQYVTINALSKRQLRLIEKRKSKAMMKAVETRERHLKKIRKLVGQTKMYRRYWIETRDTWPQELSADVDASFRQLRQVLDAMLEFDQKARARLAEEIETIKGELGTVRSAHKFNSAYLPAKGPRTPRFTDKRG